MWYVFAAVSVFGHMAFCIWIINRLHATALPYRFLKILDKSWYAFLFGLPVAIFVWLLVRPTHEIFAWNRISPFCLVYGGWCSIAGGFTLIVWYGYLANLSTTARLQSNHTQTIDLKKRLRQRPTGSMFAAAIASIPGNQVFQLSVQKKTLVLPALPTQLEGITITHISDLHFTGNVTRPFFEEIVKEANLLNSDILAITGDIVDKPSCLPWIPEVLGNLKSIHGSFFVLGNHDLRVHDEERVRQTLGSIGHFDLGGRWKQLWINEYPIFLGGNELPWFVRATNMSECPETIDGMRPFRIALTHSPDQIIWARNNRFDLMLSGHTHGGQIRFPLIGPVFAPSRFGVKYASGTFYEAPTMLHVSRGLSGTRLIRFNCRPELTQLILKCENNDR